MDAADLLRKLADVMDGHRWEQLPTLLHRGFTCRLVHTGEQFDRDSWVRLNAEIWTDIGSTPPEGTRPS